MNSTRNNVDQNGVTASIGPMWSGVWAMSICAMVLIASEFLPVSLLTPIASDLHITEGNAGQSISISGLFALITSLCLTSLIGNTDRRNVLLFFTFLIGVSGVMVAFAPNAPFLMLGRALLGVCIGGFWSMSAATVMRLVPQESVSKALAILNGGNALATTVAAPLGSFLGGLVGWRGAFFCVVPLVALAFIWQWYSVPKLPVQQTRSRKIDLGNIFRLLMRRNIGLGMLSTMLFFMGQFTLFTYLRPFLETVTGLDVGQLSLVLLAMGVFGLVGTFAIGPLLKSQLYSLLIFIPLLMTVTATLLIVFGHSLVAIYALLSLWGFLGTSAPVAWWTWLSKTLPEDAEAGGGLMVAIIQLAITIGAFGGGIVYDALGYQSTFGLAAAILVGASFVAFLTLRTEPRKAVSTATGNLV